MTPTPERLARETAYSVDDWRNAEIVLGAHWPTLWRQVADVAVRTRRSPFDVAASFVDLLDNRSRP